MSVADATRRDLVRLGGEAEECSLAAVALALAAELDDQENSATSKSMIAREYREDDGCVACDGAAEARGGRG
jgi:hypothetical protein